MNGNQQIGVTALRKGKPACQRDLAIAGSGERDPVMSSGQQDTLQFESGGERYGLLKRSGYANRPRIAASVSGVDDDQWPARCLLCPRRHMSVCLLWCMVVQSRRSI